MVTMFGDLTDL